jgi:valyl-tRNA synthetase
MLRAGESRNNVDVDAERNKERWIVARSEEQALAQAQKLLGTKDVTLERDEDVLDTWFSSGLFPFSVLGWPDDTDEFKAFYPTQLLETGLDILFFWVARMVMMGLQLTDKLPFTDVYLHAMVRDKDGRKMSKSLGNVIDPLEVIDGCPLQQLVDKLKAGNLRASEVKRAEEAFKADFPEGMPRCGTDALRVGLLAYTVQGRDINLDIKRVVGYRSFCNKLWNAVRFMLGTFDDYKASENLWSTLKPLAGRDKFILSRLRRCVLDVNTCLTEYKFGEAVQAIYHFFLDDLCDVYVELVKPVMYDADKKGKGRDAAKMVLWACLDAGLRLLHPLCPFVTEELWQRLPRTFAVSSIMVAPYPSPSEVDTFDDQAAERGTALVLETVTGARSLRAQYSLANKPAHFHCVFSNDAERASILEGRKDDCSTLMRAASVTIGNDITPPKGCGQKLVDDKLSVLVDLKGLVDADAEIKKLQKELKTVEPLVAKLEAKIKDARYLAKAPEKQRLQDREKLKSYGDKAAAARAAIKQWEEFKSGGGEDEDDDFWAEDEDEDPAAAKALEEAKAKAMAKLAKKEANQRSLSVHRLNCRDTSRDASSMAWRGLPPNLPVDLRTGRSVTSRSSPGRRTRT